MIFIFSSKLFIVAIVIAVFLNGFAESIRNNNEYRIVKTLNGNVRGKRNVTLYDEKPYYSFRGVPFARPPLGELRFKPPIPADSWTGVKDAFEYGSMCMQVTYFTGLLAGSEDCLYLNIFVPENLTNQKLAVMFFIHGGAFSVSSANPYGPDFLINNDVILVTTNYRLSVFGFMTLGNAEYSGNMGLKDQWLALKWVNDNIKFFGGDKSRITIFGESAGAGSVSFHSISPKSCGLFQRVILQSGCALNPWAFNYEDNHLKQIKKIANKYGKLKNDIYEELIDYLKIVDAEFLTKKVTVPLVEPGAGRKTSHITWAPAKEVSNATDPFMTECPEDILKRRSARTIDTMYGFTSGEFIGIAPNEISNPSLLKKFDEIFEPQLPIKYLKFDYNSKAYKKIAKEIRKFYFPKNSHVGPNTLNEFVALLSDIWFNYGIINAAKLQHRHSTGKTYLYKFSTTTLNWMVPELNINVNVSGVPHGLDLMYIFRFLDNNFGGDNWTDYQKTVSSDSLEVKSIRMVVDLWTNFAKYGTPTLPKDSVNFKPIKNNVINYADITNDGLIPKVGPLKENVKFWDDLYKKYKNSFQNAALHKEEL